MDLSQQELPLTAYFHRGTKKARPHDILSKKGKSYEPSTSGDSSSKRKRDAQGSTRNSCSPVAQLPTPATSTRKRVPLRRVRRGSHSLSPSVTRVEGNAVPWNEIDSELPESSSAHRRGRVDSHPTTSAIEQRKRHRTDAYDSGSSSHSRLSSLKVADIALATPLTTFHRTPEPSREVTEQSPTVHSPPRTLPPSLDFETASVPSSAAPYKIPSPIKPSDQSASTVSHSRANLKSPDPFRTCNTVTPGVSASTRSGTRPLERPLVPLVPVPSSQSQYLLHVDATPKRKRVMKPIELVFSSQPHEERELTLSMPPDAFDINTSLVGGGKRPSLPFDAHTPQSHARNPRSGHSERKSQHAYTLGSTPIASPVTSSPGPSRSFFATKKEVDVLAALNVTSPSRRQIKTPQKSPRNKSTAKSSLVSDDDSVTEPESDLDIIQKKNGASPRHRAPQGMDEVPSPSKPRSQRSRKSTQRGNPKSVGDDSTTEAESDTDILHCIAEISRKQARERRSRGSSDDTPSRPVISPLVSPTRSRIAASVAGSTQFFMEGGVGLSIPSNRSPSRPSARKLSSHTESIPSVVRNFIDMFEGDESYPADFPESLRF